ncbi:MACPF domain-containing protein [Platanthera zijinensis]|uniref:MACPF domain-containing protein n=1 Tax=Platanthera zijinensis TaxID=2320716 RepID=A0AAP0GBJ1_9ASPA
MREAVERALQCLGRGFDVASDFRPKHCKGKESLVLLNDDESVDLAIPVAGAGVLRRVSVDIKCDKGERVRYQSDVFEFSRMSEWFNQRNGISGKIPSGQFNAMFGFGGSSWAQDAAETKSLAMDGYFITLFDLRIDRQPLTLSKEVIDAVPSNWDPAALSGFLEKYGTHIIVGVSVGGQDGVYVRQDQSSDLSPSDLKHNLDQVGEQLFTGTCHLHPLHYKSKDYKPKISEAFNVFDPQPLMVNGFTNVSSKNGLTVVCSRRGGDPSASSHYEWLLTVPSMPDIINFTFVPITSLMKGVAGAGFISHAINLYLRYKPPVSDLQHFLEFQSHRSWAPLLNDHPLGPSSNRSKPTSSLKLALIGPKLHINTAQVIIADRRPVTGMRLHLEGKHTNCLAIHLQHLSTTPTLFRGNPATAAALRWHGSDVVAAGNVKYYEPLNWRRLSWVCTAPVEPDLEWQINSQSEKAFVVAGAQLHMDQGGNALHLRLLFEELRGSTISKSVWERGQESLSSGPSGFLQKSGLLSSVISGEKEEPAAAMPKVVVDSGVFAGGPPAAAGKLKKYVDMRERCRGAGDSPGYWVITGAKLEMEKGRIGIHVRFSLLTMALL